MKVVLPAAQLLSPDVDPVELPWDLHGGQVVRTEDGCVAFELELAGRTDPPVSALEGPFFHKFRDAKLRMAIGGRKHDGAPFPAYFTLITNDEAGFSRPYLLQVGRSSFRLSPKKSGYRLAPPDGSRAPFMVWKSDGFSVRYRGFALKVSYSEFDSVRQNIRLGCLFGVIENCDCNVDTDR